MAGKLPDKPGWWWLSWSLPEGWEDAEIRDAIEVRADGPEGLSILVDRDYETNVKEFVPVSKVCGRWIAPVPSPEVCAAVADWEAADAADQPGSLIGSTVRDMKMTADLRRITRAARKATP